MSLGAILHPYSLLLFALLSTPFSIQANEELPNIILMMADDLGWGDVGFNGNTDVLTPNLDQMAMNGLRFTRFYASAPVCSPTRGSVLTGRHPNRYGIDDANQGHLLQQEIVLTEVLAAKGFATGHFGKWHLGTMLPNYSGKRDRNPQENHMTPGMAGFEEWFSTEYSVATWNPYSEDSAHEGNTDPRTLFYHNGNNIIDGVSSGLVGGTGRIVMDKVLPFIEKAVEKQRPFFAVIWFHAPHEPVVGGPEYLSMYPDKDIDLRHYLAVVTEMDEQVGRLRARLRELGVAEKTMLWFSSDNGPEGNPQPKGRSLGSTSGLRGRKRSIYEGGIRVPTLVEWPNQVEAGRVTDFPAVSSDYFKTILSLVDYELPPNLRRPYDGISLLPVLSGQYIPRPLPIGFDSFGFASWIDNRYKLVHNQKKIRHQSDTSNAPISEWELYDLLNDRSETTNIAVENTKRVKKMKAELIAWQESVQSSSQGADY